MKVWQIEFVKTEGLVLKADMPDSATASEAVAQAMSQLPPRTLWKPTEASVGEECVSVIGRCEGCTSYICDGGEYAVDSDGIRLCQKCADPNAKGD